MTDRRSSTRGQPGRPSQAARRFLRRLVKPVVSLAFRPSLDGHENLPTERPYLLVANHSAGLGIAELASFVWLYADQVGFERPLAGFAHPIGFRIWPMTAINRALGSVPSTYEAAYDALEKGVPLLVFPGGDHETMRPIWQANRVDFGGRTGFLRIARTAGIPIVPMGIRGSHYTAPVLWRSKRLARWLVLPRLLGQKRWALTGLGILGAGVLAVAPLWWPVRLGLVWGWLTSPAIFLPWVPWSIRFRIGAPIEPGDLFDVAADEDDDLADALPRVRDAVQALVEALG